MKKLGLVFLILLSAVLFAVILAMAVKILGPGLAKNPDAGGEETVTASTEAPDIEDEGVMGSVMPPGEPDEADLEKEAEENQALLQSSIAFSFDNMDDDVQNVTISGGDDGGEEIVIPVMVEGNSGDMIMADSFRKIVCVEEKDGELVPVTFVEGETDSETIQTYAAFIEICDLLAAAGWDSSEDEAFTLPDDTIASLDGTVIPANRLLFLGDLDQYHLFRFSAFSSEADGYTELFKSAASVFSDMKDGNYAVVVNK